MKKLLFTICTPEIEEAASPFLQNHYAYAARNNYEYRVYVSRFPGEFFESNHPSFSKVPFALEALRNGYDAVLYADADVAFVDQGVDLVNLLTDDYWFAAYHQQNWDKFKYLCCGLWVVKKTDASILFFSEWKDRCILGCPAWVPGVRTKVENHPWEQWHASALFQEIDYKAVRCCNSKEIGCFSDLVWDDGVKWDRSCPTVHLAGQGKSMAEKADIYVKHYAPLVC